MFKTIYIDKKYYFIFEWPTIMLKNSFLNNLCLMLNGSSIIVKIAVMHFNIPNMCMTDFYIL